MKKNSALKKTVAACTASILIGASVMGCGAAASSSAAAAGTVSGSTDSTSSTASGTEDSNTKYGQVTAVDGSKITLSMGTYSQGGPGGQGGQAPSGTASGTTSGSMPSGGQAPSGTASGTTSGNMPSGGQGGPGGQAPQGTASGTTSDSTGNTPPAMPSGGQNTQSGTTTSGQTNGTGNGQAPADGTSGNTPPSMPSGDQSGAAPSGGMGGGFTSDGTTQDITISDESIIQVEGTDGKTTQGSLSDIKTNSILKLEYDTDGTTLKAVVVMSTSAGGGQTGTNGGGSDSSSSSATLTGATSVDGTTETLDSKTLSSTKADENTVLVTNGGNLTLTNSTLNKTGDSSSADDSNFTGLNAILCAQESSSTSISDTTLTSASEGSNAIFATGSGAKVTANNVTISTTGDSSRGLDATYGGEIDATNAKITTTGAHCAPLATDRGGGTVTLTGGTLSSSGDGSPCIYSTGDITATNVTGTATGSQCLCVEGMNTVTIDKCDLTGAGANGIMLYQSTSGDAAEGTATLNSTDSSLTTTSDGPMFYVTNTTAAVNLTNTVLNFGSGTLINCAGNNTNNWGTEGSNGGKLTFTASDETLTGNVTCDSISSVALSLKDKTSYSGAVDSENAGDVSVTLDSGSTWTLTADSYVTSLTDADTTCANILSGGHTLYYDSSNSANSWLNGKTISLSGGGKIAPMS